MTRVISAVFLLGMLAVAAASQTTTTTNNGDLQLWNDVQLNIPVGKKCEFFTKGTFRFGKNISRLTDGRFSVGFIWKPTKALTISPYYWFVDARNTAGLFRVENQLNLSATYRRMFKGVGVSHRSTIERRFRFPQNSWRYRALLGFDKDISKRIIPTAKFFVTDEVFYDSTLRRFSRNRFSVGVTKTINKHAAVDIYYMRQSDSFTHPGDLNIIGMVWKFRI